MFELFAQKFPKVSGYLLRNSVFSESRLRDRRIIHCAVTSVRNASETIFFACFLHLRRPAIARMVALRSVREKPLLPTLEAELKP